MHNYIRQTIEGRWYYNLSQKIVSSIPPYGKTTQNMIFQWQNKFERTNICMYAGTLEPIDDLL